MTTAVIKNTPYQNYEQSIDIRFTRYINEQVNEFFKVSTKITLIVSFRENADSEEQQAQPSESSEQPSTEGSSVNPQSDLTQEPGHPEESSNPSLNTESESIAASTTSTSGRNAIGRTINEIQDSITTMREEYIDR